MTGPAWREDALVFDCEGDTLVSVLCRPSAADTSPRIGVVIVVGGPQYRAGSHRQFVHWARALAAAGHASLRFDVRGMGDSSGAQRSFQALDADIAAAADTLQRHCPGLQGLVLGGLCDGASAALLYLQRRRDERIRGVVLLNPWVRSVQTLSRTYVRHYYLQRLTDRSFWCRLLHGQVALQAVRELGGHLAAAFGRRRTAAAGATAQAPYPELMAAALQQQPRPVLLALSGNDYTAKEFLELAAVQPGWAQLLRAPHVRRVDLADADHTLSQPQPRSQFERASIDWLADTVAAQSRA